MNVEKLRYGPAKEVADFLVWDELAGDYVIIPALINALLRIDTLEKQVETLSKDLAKVALSKRKYVSDGTLNKDQS